MLEEPRGRKDGDTSAGHDKGSASSGWKRAHTELVRLAQSRARLDLEEGEWLLRALRAGAHVRLGYASFAEYIECIFGYTRRFAMERVRVAEAIEQLPALRGSLAKGELGWSALRELTRVATPKTEAAWLKAACKRTLREVEKLVSGHRPGDGPADPADPALRRQVIRLEASAETLALFREAMAKVRRDAGGPLDEDAALLLMARQVLEGPKDQGRASYQIALDVCQNCQRGQITGNGEAIEVAPEIVEMAACDAQHIGSIRAKTHGGTKPAPTRATQSIPPAIRRQVMRRDRGRCQVTGCRHGVFVDVHHIHPRAEGGAHDPDLLVCLCSAHHRALHRGELLVTGCVSSGLDIRHADGTRYGGAVSPHAVERRTLVFQGLKKLGFREGDARRAVEQVATHVGPEATTETWLRQALKVLTEAAFGK